MICKKCNTKISILNNKCPNCGHDLTKVDLDRGYDYTAGRSTAGIPKHLTIPSSMSETKVSEAEILEYAVALYKKITEEQYAYYQEMVDSMKANPYLRKNKDWMMRFEKTDFRLVVEDTVVNAYAMYLRPEEDEEQMTSDHDFCVLVCGGYVNFACAVTSTFLKNPRSDKLYDMERLGKAIRIYQEHDSHFDVSDVIGILPDLDRITEYVRDSFKVIYAVIAHELGHICYSHVISEKKDHNVKSVNIGRELDADSFSYALIDSSGFRKYLWFGLIQFLIVQSVRDIYLGRVDAITHPTYIDRLITTIQRFPEAKEYGFNERWAEEIVTRILNWLR
jgi:hypothetical protein